MLIIWNRMYVSGTFTDVHILKLLLMETLQIDFRKFELSKEEG